jgi:hypothetical protein
MINNINVLVISIANPILIGIYKDNLLVEILSKEGKTSDILPLMFQDILNKYNISKIFYVNGPGSYMAIKVAYIFLKTLCITKSIEFKSADGFTFNGNTPIKALGKKYFFKANDDSISIEFLKDSDKLEDFVLPQKLSNIVFNEDTLPNYNLPVI